MGGDGGEGDFRLKPAPGNEASGMKLFKLERRREGDEAGGGRRGGFPAKAGTR